jgi:hypothetical protein
MTMESGSEMSVRPRRVRRFRRGGRRQHTTVQYVSPSGLVYRMSEARAEAQMRADERRFELMAAAA